MVPCTLIQEEGAFLDQNQAFRKEVQEIHGYLKELFRKHHIFS
jgi:hypothetical protein